ncbi:MAG: GDP-mannose 4,6-dehydratase [Methanoregula sp.]|nr:GDP-mannose 4,6-dehydratase [Methanoregula sp.]
MKSILITGISGFVGGHYAQFLCDTRRDFTIHGVSRSRPTWDFVSHRDLIVDSIDIHQCDLLDTIAVNRVLKETQPDYILHLAAMSSVAESWITPLTSFLNNTNAFLNIVEAVRNQGLTSKILSVGSSEEYGIVQKSDLPLFENHTVSPQSPYAVARVSQEYLAQIYAKGYNLNICCTRSFNHIGPGQKDTFVISSISKQFANIAVNKKRPVINIGAGSIVRDFTDISDVILAYESIFENGLLGETYNVCSGKGNKICDIVNLFSEITDIPITIEQNTNLMRPIDNPILIGSYRKLHEHTGWTPLIPLNESLTKIFDYWCNKLSK